MTYRFLLHISQAYGIPVCRPLEQEIRRRGYESAWFCENSELHAQLPGDSLKLSTPQAVVEFEPHAVLSATNAVPDFFPGIKVQVFHGFSVDKRSQQKGHFRVRGFFDLYCTHGPSTTGLFMALASELRYFEVVETGWSKVDPLFPLTARHGERPCILMASTFTPRLSLAHDDAFLAEVRRLSQRPEFDWIVVSHPIMDRQRVARLRALERENVRYVDTVDLIPLFRQADLMIADTTSAIVEFLLQRKPVVTYRNNKPGPHLINIQSPAELEAALAKALAPPADLQQEVSTFVNFAHPSADGRSSERVIDACIAFLHKDKGHLKRKPLNLWRKLQLRRQFRYYRLRSDGRPLTLEREP